MNNQNDNNYNFEDISSHSVRPVSEVTRISSRKAKQAAEEYGNRAFRNIDKAIKTIAFIVAIAVFVIFLILAGLLIFLDKAFIFLSALLLVVGAALALVFLFLIYGLGQIISQNKEILRRLDY